MHNFNSLKQSKILASFLLEALMGFLFLIVFSFLFLNIVRAQGTTPNNPMEKITAGDDYTCVVTAAKGVKCWGSNTYGQTGNGNQITPQTSAVDVLGLPDIQSIGASVYYHTCALTTAGGAKCWGLNNEGQIGNGNQIYPQLTPVNVIGFTSGVQAVTTGFAHSCLLTTGGGVKCWGKNNLGMLGNGNIINQLSPTDVVGLTSGVQAIATGRLNTCALLLNGTVKCWGYNINGQTGNGNTTSPQTSPVEVVGLTNIQAIAIGEYVSCALTNSGGVKCWGLNDYGQVGMGTNSSPQLAPIDVVGLTSGVKAISAGASHACALTTAGGVKCWGMNIYGQTGTGVTLTRQYDALNVVNLTSGVQAIAAGYYHTCALTDLGGVKCWGYNNRGQTGNGNTTTPQLAIVTALADGTGALPPPTSFGITSLTGTLKSYLSSDWSTDVSTNLQTEVKTIGIAKTSGAAKIASFNVDFTTARDWTNVSADAGATNSLFRYTNSNYINTPGRSSATYSLYVPKTNSGIRLGFCPSSTSISDVNLNCSGVQYITAPSTAALGSDTVTITAGAGGYYSNYWVVSGLSVNMGAFESPGFIVLPTSLPANTTVVLASAPATDLSTTQVTGVNTVEVKSSTKVVADIAINFSGDVSFGTVTTGSAETSAFFHSSVSISTLTNGGSSSYSLFVPKGSGTQVHICPGATSLSAVSLSCAGGYTLSVGAANLSTVTKNSVVYWKIDGLTGTGGMSLLTGVLQDTMSRLAISTKSDHELTFGTNYGVALTKTMTVEFDPGVHGFDFTGLTVADVKLTDALSTVYTISGTGIATTTAWGLTFTNDTLTFTAPSSSGSIPGASQIIIQIGTNSGGANQITNPATAGSYRLLITINGDNPEQGEVAVPIVDSDQVNVTSYINTFISFDIDTNTDNTDCAYNACKIHGGVTAANGDNYTVDLGELNATYVNKSNSNSVTHSDGNSGLINSIYFDLTSNAWNGVVVYVSSFSEGLQGPATNKIVSVTNNGDPIIANSGKYGFTMPNNATGNGTINRNSSCAVGTAFCKLINTNTEIFNTNGRPLDGGRIRMDIAAAAAYTNNPGSYTDTLTFTAVPTF